MTLEEITREALNLPDEDRVRLADQLEESLSDAELDALWAKEALRRREDVVAKKVKTVSREEAYAFVTRPSGG